MPADVPIHLIMDNYATHKTDKVKAWLAARPRYSIHFTPHLCLMAESGRAVFLNAEREMDQASGACQRERLGVLDRVLP